MNLVEAMASAAGRAPAAVGVRQGETALTYAGLDRSSAQAAAMLRARGIRPGEVGEIPIRGPNVMKGYCGKILKREISPP